MRTSSNGAGRLRNDGLEPGATRSSATTKLLSVCPNVSQKPTPSEVVNSSTTLGIMFA